MPYYAAQIANYFIEQGAADGIKVDPLKVQKLVYLAHGWHLRFRGEPLIQDKIEAWKYGPVVQDLYLAFRQYGSDTIRRTAKVPADAPELSENTKQLLAEIWKTYGNWSGIDLSMLTHEPGCAWDLARRTNEKPWSDAVIANDLIADEFRGREARR